MGDVDARENEWGPKQSRLPRLLDVCHAVSEDDLRDL